MPINKFLSCLFLSALLSLSAVAAPLNSTTRALLPSTVQQIVSVDCRELQGSGTARALARSLLARALKDGELPNNLAQLEQLETALKAAGIDPEKDIEQLIFVGYRVRQHGLRNLWIAQGSFQQSQFLQKMRARKITPERYLQSYLYPMGLGMQAVFVDPGTVMFGESVALKDAIDARDNGAQSLVLNNTLNDMIANLHSSPIWSVIDRVGTGDMMRLALGKAAYLADYDVVKNRVLFSGYAMNFSDGVTFDLRIKTSEAVSAAVMAMLAKAGMLYRRMSATPTEKMALDNVSVENADDVLQMHFWSDDQRFEALLKASLFAEASK